MTTRACLGVVAAACASRALVPQAHADDATDRRAASAAASRAVVRVLTSVDDARGCVPLTAGGFAIATGGGLAIMGPDRSVRVLTSVDGLPETRVHAVAEQGDGVWAGTEAGAAFVSLGSGGPVVKRVVGTDPVQAVYVSPNGVTYLGTRGAGVVAVDSPAAAPRPLPSYAPGVQVAAITEAKGVLYVAYTDGPLARREGGVLRPLPGSPVHGHALAAIDGSVVLGDLEGLFRFGPRGGFAPIAPVDARGIAASGDGLLVATMGAGLQAGSLRGPLRPVPGLPRLARAVGLRGASSCVATADGVFVASGEEGPARGFRRLPLGGLPSNDVTALAPSGGGRVAIGTFDRGAFLVADGGATAPVPAVGSSEMVTALAWQGERLWVATAGGLVRVDPDGSARRLLSSEGLPSSFVRAIQVLSTDRIIVGTDSGAALVESSAGGGDRIVPVAAPPAKGGHASIDSPMHATWAVASGDDGALYLGTVAGLYYGKDGRFARASVASGALEDDWVTALAVRGDDLFVGTYSAGVARLRLGDRAPGATPLGGGYINAAGLVVRGGRLYAATMEGARVRSLDDQESRWEVLAAPASGRDVTAVSFLGADLWLASRRGVVVVPAPPVATLGLTSVSAP